MEKDKPEWNTYEEHYGSILHTALRKWADSIATSIMYNAAHLMNGYDWWLVIHGAVSHPDSDRGQSMTQEIWREVVVYNNAPSVLFAIGAEMMDDDDVKSLNDAMRYYNEGR